MFSGIVMSIVMIVVMSMSVRVCIVGIYRFILMISLNDMIVLIVSCYECMI